MKHKPFTKDSLSKYMSFFVLFRYTYTIELVETYKYNKSLTNATEDENLVFEIRFPNKKVNYFIDFLFYGQHKYQVV